MPAAAPERPNPTPFEPYPHAEIVLGAGKMADVAPAFPDPGRVPRMALCGSSPVDRVRALPGTPMACSASMEGGFRSNIEP
jgi:hypothetical protein